MMPTEYTECYSAEWLRYEARETQKETKKRAIYRKLLILRSILFKIINTEGDKRYKIRGQANRISKHTNKSGDLIPRGAGVHEGKQVTVGEHILDDYFPIEKSKSRFISFTESFSHAFKYGKKVAQLNLTKLRKAIKSGELKGVYIISPRKIRKLIKNNTFLPEILKERALRLTKSDAEYLIIGNIPKDFYEIIK